MGYSKCNPALFFALPQDTSILRHFETSGLQKAIASRFKDNNRFFFGLQEIF